MIDYAAILAELEEQEQREQEALATTQAGIAAIRPLVSGGGPGSAPSSNGRRPKAKGAKPSRPAKTVQPMGGRTSPIPQETLATMKRLYESGAPLPEITAATGRSTASIYGRASADRWKRGKRTLAVKPATPIGEKLAGRTRCQGCEQLTECDPCQHCHQPLKRTWTRP